MALLDFNNLTGLDVSFKGEPFCCGATSGVPVGLDAVFRGEPFYWKPASAPAGEDVVIESPAGEVSAGGVFSGIRLFIPRRTGVMTASGACADVTTFETGNIRPEAGAMAAAGRVEGIQDVAPFPSAWIDTGGRTGLKVLSVTSGVQRRYECRIECDGLGNITIPISAFRSTQHFGYPSYSEVTIPGLRHYSEAASRLNGDFVVSAVISKGGKDLLKEDIFTAPIDKMTVTGNDGMQQIVLSGNRPAVENPGPQTAPLRGIIYRSLSYGKLALRAAAPDLYLKPGDTVTYDGDSFTARTIVHSFSSRGTFMEVREAE